MQTSCKKQQEKNKVNEAPAQRPNQGKRNIVMMNMGLRMPI